MIYGYIRVSSDKQTVENQRFEIERFCKVDNMCIDGWIEETISGTKNYNKRQLGVLLKKVEKDDIIICSELSRLGRNLFMIMEILNICMTKECRVWTIKDNYRLGDDIQSKVLAFAFGLSAEIERNLISQRTKEALARKRAEGNKWWHDKGQRLRLNPQCVAKHEWIIKQLDNGIPKSVIVRRLHVSSATLYRYLTYTGLYVPQKCHRECWEKYGIFHWPSKQGFDIVIGNPPYGAKLGEQEKASLKKQYTTAHTIKNIQKGSLDTFSLFIELGYNLLRRDGSFAMIVPLSFISSDAMSGVHRLLLNNCEQIRLSSYAVRPEPVFKNAVVDTTIVLFQKTNSECQRVYSTRLNRKKGSDFSLQRLIDNLQFAEVHDLLMFGRIPKIGTEIECNILKKVRSHKTIGSYKRTNGKPIYYRAAGGRYFKVVTNYTTYSSAEKNIILDRDYADVIGCILSSSLSFWFYQIYSDNHNWKGGEIESFTVPNIDEATRIKLSNLYKRYLDDIERNANVRRSSGNSTYHVDEFKEYKIVKSKKLIDEIDDTIGKLYGLTQDEIEFVKKYEIEFRMAGDN